MTKRQFSRAEIEYLRTLPSIDAVTDSRITYAREFQIDCMRRYLQGEKPTAIFISAGLSPSVIGHKRIERNIARWKRDEDIMRKAADDMAAGGKPDFEAMTMAQMISGLTMQLLNHSRAASGAEHLMAHLVEMKPPRFENAHGMHGQCVGVGTYLCAKEYHYLASLPTPKAKPFEPLSRAWVDEKFGPLADGIMKENENDVLGTFDAQNIVDHWDEIRAIIAEIPSAEELAALCEKLGAFYKPEQIGIDPALSEDMLSVSAAIRNRLTLIRMRRVLDFGE